MSEKEPKDEILELIRLVDRNRDEKGRLLFRSWDTFRGALGFALIAYAVIVVSVSLLVVVEGRLMSIVDTIVVILSLYTVILAFESFIAQLADRNKVEVRFQKALKLGFNENEKLILKALVKMRSKHDKFALRDVYEKNKDMFTKEKLLERLYD
jgi:hypothetical protein